MTLEVNELYSGYGEAEVLHGVSLTVEKGESIALLGPNGAGKSTTLKAITNLVRTSKGTIRYKGENITGLPTSEIVKRGIAITPEGSAVFPYMTVHENLEMGGYTSPNQLDLKEKIREIYSLFPKLKERRENPALTLSGGERTMLSLARGLLVQPSLLLVDEPSLGLDPKNVELVFNRLNGLVQTGLSLIVAEQNVKKALAITDRAYILESGRVRLSDLSNNLKDKPEIQKAYFGSTI